MESHFSLHDGVATTTSLLVLLFFLYSLHKLKNMIHTTNSKHTPPQPSGSWPFIGHLPLLGKLPHITFGNLADQYGPIFMIKLGVNRALVVSKAEMVKQCLGANDRVFANRPHTIFVDHLTYKSAMVGFTPYGEYWRQIRKIFTVELLSSHRIEMLKDVRINEVKAAIKVLHDHCMMENLRGNAVDSLTVDLQKWFNDVTMNSIVRLIAGKSMKEFYEGEKYDKYAKAFREFFELAGVFLPADALPFLRWIDIGGHEKKMKKLAKVMDQIVDDWLMDHKERIGCKNSQPQDFMDMMLNKFENGQEISSIFDTDTIIKANCMNLILAASDTSGTTLTWALALLVNNLDILKKAQAELDKVVGKERQVEESDIKNLVYLQAIVKETLRLYPPGTLSVPREAITECTIGGYHIPARTQLLVNLYKLHRDPNVWENPLEFNPERFLTSHKDYDVIGKNFEYLPFASGRRLCPGISYALRIMHFTLATLLHEFQVLSPLDQLVDMSEDFGLSNSKATPLELILKKRLPHN